jgi:hypothetical protein
MTATASSETTRSVATGVDEGLRYRTTNYLGDVLQEGPDPQAFLVELAPETKGDQAEYIFVKPHFHLVRQFQVVVRGERARIGKNELSALDFHYVDPSTPYGPIVADANGIAFYTLRPRGEIDAHWMPGSREELTATRGRNIVVRRNEARELTAPVKDLIERHVDGLAGFRIELEPNESRTGPPPSGSGGQYYLVAAGLLRHDGAELPPLSLIWVGPDDDALTIEAGQAGAEVIVMQFPVWNPEIEPKPGDRRSLYGDAKAV